MRTFFERPALSPIAALNPVDQKFRQWWQKHGLWSQSAERLFLCLLHDQQVQIPVTSQQKQLLQRVIEDALDGISVTERYPALFRDLLCNALLRQEFVNLTRQIDLPVTVPK